MDEELLNETLLDLLQKCGIDMKGLDAARLLDNLAGVKAAVEAKQAGEPTAWEAHNLAIASAFLAHYTPE